MKEVDAIIETLKHVLKAKGITYEQLADSLDISEASVKRIFSAKTFTLDRLEKICNIADLSITELAMIHDSQKADLGYEYTMEQEDFFADHPRHLAYFDLLLRVGSAAKIEKAFNVSKRSLSRYQKDLEGLKLIERHPKGKVKILVSKKVRWRVNGPLQKKYSELARQEFLESPFKERGEISSFHSIQLSEKSATFVANKLKEISQEVERINEFESQISSKSKDYGLFIGFRPWAFSILNEL